MTDSNQRFSKQEKEKRKQQKKKEKKARKEERKSREKNSLDSMIAYVDENGMITDRPPDPEKKREEVDLESIDIGGSQKTEEEAEESFSGKYKGSVRFFNTSKGYGFINEQKSGNSYFVHENNCIDPISEGDAVTFDLKDHPKGKVAVDVKRI
ncbi:MAG: cold shock domain-containing protein [Flavobacteriales bacterium]|nr:cold shock domain-containing protein [Flavobacteriales bacterium]